MKRKGHSDYRWQRQQETKRKFEKIKKIKEKWENMPVDASNELDYIKKLLDGQDVGNFVGENDSPVITKKDLDEAVKSVWGPSLVQQMKARQHALNLAMQADVSAKLMRQSEESFGDYLNRISGKGYFE
jgi:hypothetical protein